MQLWTGQLGRSGTWTSPLPLWDGPSTLVVAFGGPELIDTPRHIKELAAHFATSVVVGCSTSGEIYGDTLEDGTLTVAVARFATTRLTLAHEQVHETSQSRAVGARLAERLSTDPELRGIFVLSDGQVVNGSELTLGLGQVSAHGTVVTGGLAGDGDRFGATWVIVDGEARHGMVTAVGLAGPDLTLGHGSRGGFDILGPERRVTRSAGNVLFELDGSPALDLYKQYLGDRADGLPATGLLFPLLVRVPGSPEPVVRTILGVDEQTHSMRFAGDVPEGSSAQLMRANTDRIIDGAADAGAQANVLADAPLLALAISCVGRRLVLGSRTEDELEALVSALPSGAGVVGFYSYGEISPVAAGTCDLMNQTMTVTTLQETPRAAHA